MLKSPPEDGVLGTSLQLMDITSSVARSGASSTTSERCWSSSKPTGKEVDTVVNMSLELTGMFVSFVCDTYVCNMFTDMYHT